jgi:hypothetical protein
MKRMIMISFAATVIVSVALFCALPAEGKSLTTAGVGAIDGTGTYTLILYGGRHFRDVESLALLDLEGDAYTLEPFAPDFDFRVIKNLPAREALERAEHFLRIQYAFRQSLLSRILDSSGKTIGYEVRPLYDPLTFGLSDVLDVDYSLRNDGKVRVHIRLKLSVERQLFSGDGSRDGSQ